MTASFRAERLGAIMNLYQVAGIIATICASGCTGGSPPTSRTAGPTGTGANQPTLVPVARDTKPPRVRELLALVRERRSQIEPGLVRELIEQFLLSPVDNLGSQPAIIAALGIIGPGAAEAVPALEAAHAGWMGDNWDTLFWKPLWTNADEGRTFFRKKNWFIPPFNDYRTDGCVVGVPVQQMIEDTLKEIGPAGAETLSKALDDPRKPIRVGAAFALARSGHEDRKRAVSILSDVIIERKEAALRGRAAEALGQIGPAARDAIPILTALLNDDDVAIRKVAQAALTKVR